MWQGAYAADCCASVGAIPVGKTGRLGPSVCLKDELCISLCSHAALLRSGTPF